MVIEKSQTQRNTYLNSTKKDYLDMLKLDEGGPMVSVTTSAKSLMSVQIGHEDDVKGMLT